MKFLKKLCGNIEEIICLLIMVVILAITFNNIICRYILHASLSYTDEVTTGLFVYLTMFGTAVAAKRKAHLGLSLLTDRMPEQARHIVLSLTFILCAVFSVALTYTGYVMMLN